MKGSYWLFKTMLLVLGAAMLLPLPLVAQLKCNITHYATKDGLSHDGVLCITRDREGFMWFGTFDGINRFDGHNFVVYKSRPGDRSSLRSNKIRHIVEDKQGYLWIQTFDYKIYRFDKKTEQFLTVSDGHYKALFEDQVVVDRVIADSVSGVWLFTKARGMYHTFCNAGGTPIVKQYTPKNSPASRIKGWQINFHCTDAKGNIWVGTEAGLNCLQLNGDKGYQTVNFGAGLTPQLLTVPFTSAAKNNRYLYFGTGNGHLLIQNIATKKFTVQDIAIGTKLNSICISKTGALYIATGGKGLIRFDPVTLKQSQSQMAVNDSYFSLYEDKAENLWIEPEKQGIINYNPHTGIYKQYIQKRDFTSASREYHVVTDANGTLWASMKGGGFGYYDAATDSIKYFYDEPGSPDQQFSNVITSFYLDQTGVLWLSAKDGGINQVVTLTDKFNYRRLVTLPQNRSENDVRGMMKDSKGRLWICTKDGLVHVYDHDKAVNLFANTGNRIGFVYTLIEDSKGNVWLGTKGNGLFKATPTNPERSLYTLQNFKSNKDDAASLSNNQVYSVIEDHKGRIWVGTLGGGLNLVANVNGQTAFKNHNNNFHSFPYSWAKVIRHLCEDNQGRMWIATSYGLLVFDTNGPDESRYQFVPYRKIPGNPNSLGNNSVQYICKDKTGQIWLGTFGGGLNKVIVANNDINRVSFQSFTTANGLPNDVVLSITVDLQNNLWIATAGGLSKFNPQQRTFKNYDVADGLPNAAFSEATCFTAPDSKLYFGCVDGYLSFNPADLVHQKITAQIALTHMQLYYKDIVPQPGNSPLTYAINETKVLTLNDDQNVISLDYAVLDYRAPNKISYAYKLENFDKTWHLVNDLRKATYTNIPPGTYTFKVKGISDDLFNNVPQKTLQIIIKPPFYLTGWAYGVYFILLVIAVALARNIITTMIRLRNKVTVEQKLTEVKLSFFTNISHELRTPLTLIASPLEELSQTEELSAKGREYFKIINRNVNRMIRFTNQLLDFRKIQSGKMQINVTETDLVTLAKEVGSCFTTIAAEKNISLKINASHPVIDAWVDEEKIEIILYNLLSNAFKFSPPDKQVTLQINRLNDVIELQVIDEGKGVSADSLEEIFEIYHEENPSKENHLKGTGIGLALARGLAISHQGKLWAALNSSGGMTFTLQLLAGHEHFAAADIHLPRQTQHQLDQIITGTETITAPVQVKANHHADTPQLLVVEDNPDLRTFLEIKLGGFYRVLTAKDGIEGLAMARTAYPDLILSDVVMPHMDGIHMLDELKHDQNTSHIPVILLTAKSSVESQIKGMQYGADAYLTKPFHNDLLLASIQNLLTSRKRMFEQLAGTQPENPAIVITTGQEQPITTSRDEAFLKEVIKLVEERMQNPDFNIDEVAAGIGMGRTTFYKKLKSLSALSPVEFVREMRLKRSKQLLDSGLHTVSEAGYMAGFNSLPYFSTCFKDKYQLSPSAYLKKIKPAASRQAS